MRKLIQTLILIVVTFIRSRRQPPPLPAADPTPADPPVPPAEDPGSEAADGEEVAPLEPAPPLEPAAPVLPAAAAPVSPAPVPPATPTRHLSAIAKLVPSMGGPAKRRRTRKPWGFLVHTTGRGVVSKARETGRSPLEVAISVYRSSQKAKWGGAHYLIDHDGTIYQLAADDIVIAHAGKEGARWFYKTEAHQPNPSWHKGVPFEAVKHWIARWAPQGHNDPFDLFPSASPNVDFVGAEMIAVGSGFGEPAFPGALHTKAQHLAVIALARDLAKRHGWPANWHRTSRLLGHEDVQPQARSIASGSWDPGHNRDRKYFDFAPIWVALDEADRAA